VGAAPSKRELAVEQRTRAHLLRHAGTQPRFASAGFGFVAGPVPAGHGEIYATGRSPNPKVAARKADAEAWERRGWAHLGRAVEGSRSSVRGAMDPRAVITYSDGQYSQPDFPFKRFHDDAPYLWSYGCDIATCARVALPAECVHALSALPRRFRNNACTTTSTSGTAAWTDVEGALCRATLELVERDSFLRCWLSGKALPSVLRPTLPSWALRRVEELEGAGLSVAVLQVRTELACVMVIFMQSRSRPFTAVTSAAEFHPECALLRALDEAEGRATHALAQPARPLADGEAVSGIADVNRYYQTPALCHRADFLVSPAATCRFGAPSDACGTWEEMQARLARTGHRILAFDLTPEHASIDQGREPLHVVRAVVPGLLPIWFASGLEPGGLPAYRSRVGQRAADPLLSIHPLT
jgi:ribosomal protein S12 methylthiotransferase accessory factor